MTKKIIWRMGKLPSVDELRELVKDKIITNEEAREILFSNEDIEERDKKSLESEIKFLRELVEKLAKDKTTIVEKIKYIEKPYYQFEWYRPYVTWCSNSGLNITNQDAVYYASGSQDINTFSDIKTF